jgi:transcription antitermination factor NusG
MNNKFKWYALLVSQKKEFYVKEKLLNLLDDEISNNIQEILLPVEKEIHEIRRKKLSAMFLFIQIIYS